MIKLVLGSDGTVKVLMGGWSEELIKQQKITGVSKYELWLPYFII